MRKLYNRTKATRIHPSPPPPPQPSSSATANRHLSTLPFAIATLATALSSADKEVLAYLLSISATTNTTSNSSTGRQPTKNSGAGGDHPPQFNCNCFGCYTSFWARWDASPNQKVIHEIIDVYEDGLIVGKKKKKNGKNKKDRRSKEGFSSSGGVHVPVSVTHALPQVEQKNSEEQQGCVRKIVNFVGERIWGVWGI